MLAGLTENENRRLSTAVHEASHSVLAAVNDITVDRAEVLSTVARVGQQEHAAGYAKFLPYDAITELSAPQVLAGGAVGELIFQLGGRPTLTQVLKALTASHTHDNAELQRLSLKGGRNPAEPVLDALPLVDRLWQPIARLAWQLHKERRIEHADVLAALGIPSAADAHRYTRAIRAGAAPGELCVGRQMF